MGIRDTEILFAFCLLHVRQRKGNIFRFRADFLGAPGGDCGGGACACTVS